MTAQVSFFRSHWPQTSPLPRKDLIGLEGASWQKKVFESRVGVMTEGEVTQIFCVFVVDLPQASFVVQTSHAGPTHPSSHRQRVRDPALVSLMFFIPAALSSAQVSSVAFVVIASWPRTARGAKLTQSRPRVRTARALPVPLDAIVILSRCGEPRTCRFLSPRRTSSSSFLWFLAKSEGFFARSAEVRARARIPQNRAVVVVVVVAVTSLPRRVVSC